MAFAYGLVIFDCDGVLVDSERLAVRVEAEVLCELGWPLTEDDVVERFVGRSAAYMHAEIERELGRSRRLGRDVRAAAPRGLRGGARGRRGRRRRRRGALGPRRQLAASRRAARTSPSSSSSGAPGCGTPSRARSSAWRTSRAGSPPRTCSCTRRGELGAAPEACAVIEDSESGVTAGVAAGMAVFAFAGGVTRADRLARPGVTVFHEMSQLLALLAPSARRGGEAAQIADRCTAWGAARATFDGAARSTDRCRGACRLSDSEAPWPSRRRRSGT